MNIDNLVGKKCTAVGTCGMSKDKNIIGVLLNKTIGGDPVLQCSKKRLHSVNIKTLKEL